jgi:hypothetical protein
MTAPAEPQRLAPRGRLMRAAFTVGTLTALAVGTFFGSNQLFPAGPMTQYAFYIAPDGIVVSNTMWADTTTGERVHVQLNASGVGVKRADIEAQLPAIIANPSLLRTVATGQRRLHPDQPQFTTLYVMRTVTQLRDRVPVSKTSSIIVTWHVTP